MKRRLAALFLIVLWSIVNRYVIWPLGKILGLVSDRVRDQLKEREQGVHSVVELAGVRRRFDDCAVFFCSSAGEYEQARPIIDRLSKTKKMFCHVVFFSRSGPKFLRARNDGISWSLAPLDDVFAWGGLFAALRPSVTFVVRHELWPAFLWAAAEWSKIVVINAVVPSMLGRQSQLRESINLMAKAWLLRFVDMVCVVSITDRQFFMSRLGLLDKKVQVTGDTKYDRVLERALTTNTDAVKLRDIFRQKWSPTGTDTVLIGGSVHLPDVELIIDAMKDERLNRVRILLVPHDVSSANIAKIFEMIANRGFPVELFSEIKAAEFDFPNPQPRCIIIDELGRLFDLYSVADLAWVGGAVHDKVHNVLEPAACGIPVSCGIKMENSQEAVAMRSAGLLTPALNASVARDAWLGGLSDLETLGRKTKEFAEGMTGAAEKVIRISSLGQAGVISHD
jgi:3-deoxy-D-manno-octulosonic-acid transferase